jgi:hypothetical protein
MVTGLVVPGKAITAKLKDENKIPITNESEVL